MNENSMIFRGTFLNDCRFSTDLVQDPLCDNITSCIYSNPFICNLSNKSSSLSKAQKSTIKHFWPKQLTKKNSGTDFLYCKIDHASS